MENIERLNKLIENIQELALYGIDNRPFNGKVIGDILGKMLMDMSFLAHVLRDHLLKETNGR